MTPEAKAKLRAAEKARHKGLTLPTTDPDAAPSANADAPGATATPAAVSNSKAYSELPAGTRATYDKQGLLKKSMLVRLQQNKRQLHHYDLGAPPHTAATRDERKMRKHSKNPGPKGAEPEAPAATTEPEPAPDPTQPAPALTAPAAKPSPAAKPAAKTLPPRPAKVAPKPRQPKAAPPQAPAPAAEPAPTTEPAAAPAKKAKKDKKAPKAPKPDPTQPPADGQ